MGCVVYANEYIRYECCILAEGVSNWDDKIHAMAMAFFKIIVHSNGRYGTSRGINEWTVDAAKPVVGTVTHDRTRDVLYYTISNGSHKISLSLFHVIKMYDSICIHQHPIYSKITIGKSVHVQRLVGLLHILYAFLLFQTQDIVTQEWK